jgi:hypothetical protein
MGKPAVCLGWIIAVQLAAFHREQGRTSGSKGIGQRPLLKLRGQRRSSRGDPVDEAPRKDSHRNRRNSTSTTHGRKHRRRMVAYKVHASGSFIA